MHNKLTGVILGLLLAGSVSDGYTQMPKVVSPSTTQQDVRLSIDTVESFGQKVSLARGVIGRNINQDSVALVLNSLKASGVVDQLMVSAAYDADTGTIFATTGTTTAITNSYPAGPGLRSYVLSSKNSHTGKSIHLTRDMVWVGTPGGKPVLFQQQGFAEAQGPMAVTLLVDGSGSMGGHMDKVLAAVEELLDQLPDHIHCSVISFGGAITDRAIGQKRNCHPTNFAIRDISAEGGTPLFGALRQGFNGLSKPALANHQKVVIVLTDGNPTDEDDSAGILGTKNDIATIFFWLGDKVSNAETVLWPYADTFVADSQSAVARLKDYFKVIAEDAVGQSVITVPVQTK